jgi:hypothetical protein
VLDVVERIWAAKPKRQLAPVFSVEVSTGEPSTRPGLVILVKIFPDPVCAVVTSADATLFAAYARRSRRVNDSIPLADSSEHLELGPPRRRGELAALPPHGDAEARVSVSERPGAS